MDSSKGLPKKKQKNYSINIKGNKSLKALLNKKCDVTTCFFSKEKKLGNLSGNLTMREAYKDGSKFFFV